MAVLPFRKKRQAPLMRAVQDVLIASYLCEQGLADMLFQLVVEARERREVDVAVHPDTVKAASPHLDTGTPGHVEGLRRFMAGDL